MSRFPEKGYIGWILRFIEFHGEKTHIQLRIPSSLKESWTFRLRHKSPSPSIPPGLSRSTPPTSHLSPYLMNPNSILGAWHLFEKRLATVPRPCLQYQTPAERFRPTVLHFNVEPDQLFSGTCYSVSTPPLLALRPLFFAPPTTRLSAIR